MKSTKDYSRELTPAFTAVEDIKRWLGKRRFDVISPEMARVVDKHQFAMWASLAGISGFPVKAWYELYHGGGSWDKAPALPVVEVDAEVNGETNGERP